MKSPILLFSRLAFSGLLGLAIGFCFHLLNNTPLVEHLVVDLLVVLCLFGVAINRASHVASIVLRSVL